MWAIAGDKPVMSLKLFSSPEEPGFNGREALSKGIDRFYNSMKSVTELTTMLVQEYDRRPRKTGSLPRLCVVAFPIILVEGQLFEAYFCEEDSTTKIREAQQIRCHWRGSPSWTHHATIDIVTLAAFDEFRTTRAAEAIWLVKRMTEAHEQVKACIKAASFDPLNFQPNPRGMLGIPPLLRETILKAPMAPS